MKLKVNRDHLVSGLQKVQNIVGTRSTMPILNNVLFKAEEDGLSLTTTNLDLGISCKIKAETADPGTITLPVKKLLTIVRSLPTLEVNIELVSSNQVKIASGGARFRIMGIQQEEFPPLPVLPKEYEITVQQEELARMIKSVAYAQSTDENRYILNGIYFNFKDEKLTLVATDGRRLGLISHSVTLGEDKTGTLILPAKTALELERLLGHGEMVNICFTDRQVSFDISVDEKKQENGLISNVYLVSKVVEGKYPNYKQVIPKEISHRIKLDRELFLDCLSRAALVTSEKSNSIRLTLDTNHLEIKGSSPDLGESYETMAIEFEGPKVELSFNPQFLMDPLKAIPRDEVFFEFKDELSPGLFKSSDSFLCVIMPLRLN